MLGLEACLVSNTGGGDHSGVDPSMGNIDEGTGKICKLAKQRKDDPSSLPGVPLEAAAECLSPSLCKTNTRSARVVSLLLAWQTAISFSFLAIKGIATPSSQFSILVSCPHHHVSI
jgi:hypothetical protein